MPFRRTHRGGRFTHRGRHTVHRHRHHTARVKTLQGLFPQTAHTVCQLNTDFLPQTTGAPQGQLSLPLNCLYRPFNYMQLAGGPGTVIDCPPYLYLDASTPGTGLVGSSATGAAYRQWKVLATKFKIEIVNRSAAPVRFQGYLDNPIPNPGVGAVPTYTASLSRDQQQRDHFDLMVPVLSGQGKPTIVHKYIPMTKAFQRTHAQIAADYGDSNIVDSMCVSDSGVGAGTMILENPSLWSIYTMRVTDIDGAALAASQVSVRLHVKWWIMLFNRNFIIAPDIPQLEEKHPDEDPEEDPPEIVEPPPTVLSTKCTETPTPVAAKAAQKMPPPNPRPSKK